MPIHIKCFPWNAERREYVRKGWVEFGKAASTIAAELTAETGRHVTRNAVIGIVHRNGWGLHGIEYRVSK